jgi:beta-glucosidase/6-phospho-beta-glucosidase/beta-galactosidase
MTIFEPDLYFLIIYQYVKFELNVFNRYSDYVRKPIMTEERNDVTGKHYGGGIKIPKGNNSKNSQGRVMAILHCTSIQLDQSICEVSC